MLRTYQVRIINELITWLRTNKGNPCLQMPTGSGKSWIIAAFCEKVLQGKKDAKILMLAHVQELIEQNYDKLITLMPNVDAGIYSAGLGRKELNHPITYGSIQSLRKSSEQLGFIDFVIVDECHLISHEEEGGYRNLIAELTTINPKLKVIGLTATPYRLGHGYITEEPAIFTEILNPVSIEQLITLGFLAPLRSKLTDLQYDTSEVAKRGKSGDFKEKELQECVNTTDLNAQAVAEIVKFAGTERKAWLIFCAGIEHAFAVTDELRNKSITSECITGELDSAERKRILQGFKSGNIKALTNVDVLTTGFDYPDIDLIAFLRPTQSTSLYVQMAGRGMRPKSHIDDCLILDFAGLVKTHGPVTNPSINNAKHNLYRICPECREICNINAIICPHCGYVFEKSEDGSGGERKTQDKLDVHADIMDDDKGKITANVTSWDWVYYISKKSGKEMIRLVYHTDNVFVKPVDEYLCINHDGYARDTAWRRLAKISLACNVKLNFDMSIEDIQDAFEDVPHPDRIIYKKAGKDNKFFKVLKLEWDNPPQAIEKMYRECNNCKCSDTNGGTCDQQDECVAIDVPCCNDWEPNTGKYRDYHPYTIDWDNISVKQEISF